MHYYVCQTHFSVEFCTITHVRVQGNYRLVFFGQRYFLNFHMLFESIATDLTQLSILVSVYII